MHPAQQQEFTADGGSVPARPLVPVCFDQADQLLGHEDVSAWLTVDREHLREFSHATYLDPAYVDLTPSRNHALGPDLVDGFLLLSLIVHFEFAQPLMQTDGRYGYNYGLDRVRFTRPVFAGQAVRVRRTVAAVQRKSASRVLVTVDHTMEAQDSEPVMVARWLMLYVDGRAEP
jgi:acyl dehydratase